MARALRLAERGLATTDPNPRVGCVLVRDERVVGEGWHRRAGEAHAEIHALREAGGDARGATAYVTLEPCAHHGRTPPCAEALRDAGVVRVVVASEDPNPQVAGQGLQLLGAAGVATASGLMEAEAEALNPGFMKRMRTGMPYVRCKLAMSLDGRTAMASGESRWITGAAARRDVHQWRARSSAMLTGVETVLADDPALTVRDAPEPEGGHRQPLRVIFDSWLRTPPSAAILRQPGRTVVLYTHPDVHREMALEEAGADLWQAVPGPTRRVDPALALGTLAGQQVNEVMVEAGPTLSGTLLQADLVDELIVYMAPHLLGHEGNPLLRLPGLSRMSDRVGVTISEVRQFGDDLRIIARPRDW
ncbi:bifunctional diaminohydroxyphosphoribosylaminopyrimidine deaminase/5-amino-6-(5-phosphoribosylamino)uracil reductase RibD [Ectothiorhodospiraceae bacterium WFHF3C12]|nr:bifunctional diaminohydroxyphosphoribosylaminopyrimidine deaminase/5-amino-6-(5-phosphoribosylamino)uracil reductase RibD [Ectothiorhodospiraceae bacterium WFHF3C12]